MIYKICALGLVGAILFVLLGNEKKEYAILVLVGVCVMIMMISLPYLTSVITVIKKFASLSNASNANILTILKIVSISYIAQFASDIATDNGAVAIAKKIEMGAKFFIMYLSLPIFLSLFNYINEMLG